MNLSPSTRLYAAFALSLASVAGVGGYAGFRLAGAWGSLTGAAVGTAGMLLGAKIAMALAGLRVEDSVRAALGDGRAEGTEDTVLMGISLYKAASFPLTPGGVSPHERQVRRTVAYRLAAHDGLPLAVRVAAAEALEVIDESRDVQQARSALNALALAIYNRRGAVHDDEVH
ncbi:hypothetical protein [Streptomyces fructofermentans]|uniref:Uncharacterized protein n=1 Tax=Streptomyces fructofermentans TaxID=152141 RepID=A0A918NUE8_9ACTN|nr:hypothetical protein [Streptomyces fructofermentans]GGX95582.1 hypothetical protein GCM10010515_72820 [Streptomyces fructofermentans]